MTAEELRRSFIEFAGQPTARRFALQLRGDKEAESRPPYRQRRTDLRFWQEQLWDQFSQRNDGVPQDLDEIRDALLWCDVHDRILETGKAVADACGVTDRDGNLLDETFGHVRDEQFPFGFGLWFVPTVSKHAVHGWTPRPAIGNNEAAVDRSRPNNGDEPLRL